jgi:N-acetylneuraminic acid mutarotase
LQGKIYIAGGLDWNTGTVFDTLQIFNTFTGTWTEGSALPAPRRGVVMAASGGKVYAFGGSDPSGVVSNATFIYDPGSNTWTQGASMPVGVDKGAATALDDGRIRVYGGFTGPYIGNETATVQEYQPSSDSWTTLADMPSPRGGLAVDASSIYVAALHGTGGPGGYYGRNDGDFYSFGTDSWISDAVDGPVPLYTPGGAVFFGRGYVADGFNYDSYVFSQGVYRFPIGLR